MRIEDTSTRQAVRMTITYFTDPLCCWSWAMEPHRQQLNTHYGNRIRWQYCMGGLIPDWNAYADHRYNVFQPSQMGPLWMYVGRLAGRPVRSELWVKDPPASSYPACLAVKCAELQSAEAGEQFLFLAQKAALEEGMNIAKKETLLQLAVRLEERDPAGFDSLRFADDFESGSAREQFRSDLQKMHAHGVKRLPSLLIEKEDGRPVLISGYRSPEMLVEAVKSGLETETDPPVPKKSHAA